MSFPTMVKNSFCVAGTFGCPWNLKVLQWLLEFLRKLGRPIFLHGCSLSTQTFMEQCIPVYKIGLHRLPWLSRFSLLGYSQIKTAGLDSTAGGGGAVGLPYKAPAESQEAGESQGHKYGQDMEIMGP